VSEKMVIPCRRGARSTGQDDGCQILIAFLAGDFAGLGITGTIGTGHKRAPLRISEAKSAAMYDEHPACAKIAQSMRVFPQVSHEIAPMIGRVIERLRSRALRA
jgi:hypothetical protein